MKIEKFREMSREELSRKLTELQDSLFQMKVKIQTKQVENTATVAATRKDIARVKTLLRQAELKDAQAAKAAAAEAKK